MYILEKYNDKIDEQKDKLYNGKYLVMDGQQRLISLLLDKYGIVVSRFSDWLKQGGRNLLSAQVNLREGIYEEVCIESRQAAEKALKSLLNYLHKERRGIHYCS